MRKINQITKFILSFIILFLPLTISFYFKKNWQEAGLVLIPSVLLFVLLNLSQFEILKFGKDGVEIRSKLEKADNYLEYIKSSTISMVNTQISLAEQSFTSNTYQEALIYEELVATYNSSNLSDSSLEKRLDKFRNRIKARIRKDTYRLIEDYRDNMTDEEKDIWIEVMAEMNLKQEAQKIFNQPEIRFQSFSDFIKEVDFESEFPNKKDWIKAYQNLIEKLAEIESVLFLEQKTNFARMEIETLKKVYDSNF